MTRISRFRPVCVLWAFVLLAGAGIWLGERGKQPAAYSVRVFHTATGWGYEISEDGRPVIYQPYRPGVAGRRGFDSAGQARRVGRRVLAKLEAGSFPPTLRPDELY